MTNDPTELSRKLRRSVAILNAALQQPGVTTQTLRLVLEQVRDCAQAVLDTPFDFTVAEASTEAVTLAVTGGQLPTEMPDTVDELLNGRSEAEPPMSRDRVAALEGQMAQLAIAEDTPEEVFDAVGTVIDYLRGRL